MSQYVYVRSEGSLWTTGFYDPDGKWHADQDHDSRDEAANRVHWLNGGTKPATSPKLKRIVPSLAERRTWDVLD